MGKIENLKIRGCSASKQVMNKGYNESFMKQREENKEYDSYLQELFTYLSTSKCSAAKQICKCISYKGDVLDLAFFVIPHVNDMFNDGVDAKAAASMVLDGTWLKYDSCMVYEAIEFKEAKYGIAFVREYLSKLKQEDDISLIHTVDCKIILNQSVYTLDSITDDDITNCKEIQVKTALQIPWNKQSLGPVFWKNKSLRIPGFNYRAIIEHENKYQTFMEFDGEIVELENKTPAYISKFQFKAIEFTVSISGELDHDLNLMLEHIADTYGLIYPYIFSEDIILGGNPSLNIFDIMRLKRDLEQLYNRVREINGKMEIQGIFLSDDEPDSYMENALSLILAHNSIGLGVIDFK